MNYGGPFYFILQESDRQKRIENGRAEAKEESDTESKRQRKILIEGRIIQISPKRRMLPIEDSPLAIREEGETASELPAWLGNAVSGVIQQLKQAIREKGDIVENVQILIEAIKDCESRLSELAQEGERNPRIRQNEDGRERARKKRYDFLKQIWEAIYFKITERIQELRTYISHDVELKLRNSCGAFRVDMGGIN